MRCNDTHASVRPFSTHGKALSGAMSILSNAMVVNTVAAVNLLPIKIYVVKVKIEINIGVVAQKYTHNASRYLRPLRYFNSWSRISALAIKTHME